jgi:O-antigen ligase
MMFIVLLALVALRPFIPSPAFPYENFVYSTVLLGFLLVWVATKGVAVKENEPILYATAALAAALLLTLLFSPAPLTSLREIYKYVSGVLLLMIVTPLGPQDKTRLTMVLLLTGLIISLMAIYQYFFGFQHLLDYVSTQNIREPSAIAYVQRKRVFFPFITPNILAGYLAMLIPLTLARRHTLWLIVPLAAALLLTKSLGAILSLFAALMIFFYLEGKLKLKGVLLLSGVCAGIGFVSFARSVAHAEYHGISFSALMRLNYWQDTLAVIKASPLTGIGLGSFSLPHSRYAHNAYLQLWAEAGFLGAASFSWLVIARLRYLIKNRACAPGSSWTNAVVTAGLVFLLHNLVDFSFFLPEASLIWWIVMGLA